MTLKILVLCTGNSCRSQMAEGYLRYFLGDKAEVFSAGLEAHGLNPRAVSSMAEDGLDITPQTSNRLDDYLGESFTHILTVCDHAQEHCPLFPGQAQRLHQSFPDPAKAQGTEAEIRASFTQVREAIKSFCQNWVNTLLQTEL